MTNPPLSVAIIGAGMSGLCMGIKLRDRGIDDFVILEKSAGVGGTWYDNTYPGACCDVPSVLYSYSFEPNPWWSRKYSPHNEIRAYFEHCADKYELRSRLRLETPVSTARFDEERGLWVLALANGEQIEARALVSGLGQLNLPYTPEFEGAGEFTGEQFHSARWNHDVDLTGKRVAVIGNAASALQFIPHVAQQAAQVNVYQRSANYVIPRNDSPYTAKEQQRFSRHPWWQKLHRFGVYLRAEGIFYPTLRGRSLLRRLWVKWCRDYLNDNISDPVLKDKLTPDYPVGCKRILISDDYYQALARDNVDVVTSPITGISEEGVCTEDREPRPADVIIYGTGFRTSEMLSGVQFTGRDGLDLQQAWRDGAEAYRGVCVSGFPNFFMLYGPNTNLGSNSIIFMTERQVNYAVACIEKLLTHDLRSLDVNANVMRDYNRYIQKELDGTVWVASCDSWYKNAAGKVVNNWPRSTTYYWWHMRAPEFTDFDMT
ncbi:NAD(P)/FAD-dependent oxidoreductase [Parahaliea maris]|uniref:NAD(P)/FAD-dependent oxidoreductase n=1 Tax=Parahaliea maris TaxID=2716870 RepID=A0A5C9A2D8_9GAMM|nr:NAD(P)/FAD-dependent oxidoreductase [Parahaliea maris]TXS93777.1 NAD(P)/FAD-dependent oxidoreductase [Parahaliea maris]